MQNKFITAYHRQYIKLIVLMVKRELKVKYRGTLLGYLWSMLNPLLSMLVISFVFSHLVKNIPTYHLFVLSGVLLWSMANVSLQIGAQSIVSSAYLLRKIKLPIWIFPMIPIGSTLINMLLSLIPYAALFAYSDRNFPEQWYLMPLVVVCFLFFIAGLSLAIGCLNVFFRDIQHVLEPVLSLVFYATPIIYDRHGPNIPDTVAKILGLNPFTHYIEVFRAGILGTPLDSNSQIVIIMILPFFSMFAGISIYRMTRRNILFKI